MIGIYKLTSPSNKVYIGQSIDIDTRLAKYKNANCKEQPLIYNAIKKYGWDNFKVDILWSSEDTTNAKDILNELEIDIIKIYDSLSPNGYNLQTGGNSALHSEESKKKIGDYHRNKIASKETLIKMSLCQMKAVIQLDKDGNYIREWSSGKEVERELGIFASNISKVIKGKHKLAGGYKWKLIDKKINNEYI